MKAPTRDTKKSNTPTVPKAHDADTLSAGKRLVTEELASHELLSALMHVVPVGLWIMDATGKILTANQAGITVWGGIRYVSLEGFAVYKGWWPESGQPLQPHDWSAARAIFHGETVLDQIVEIETFDGKRKTITNSAIPLRDAGGRILGAIVIASDISERIRFEKALHYSNQLLESSREELRRATARLEQRVEDERKQIARDLHVQLGQSLIALKMGLTSLAHLRSGESDVQSATAAMLDLVDKTIDSTRRISQGLRPFVLDHLGLSAAIESLLQDWSVATGVKHTFRSTPERITIDQAGSIAVYRLVQEALNNVAHHSGASRVDVRMRVENENLRVEIADNGKGIEPEKILAADSLGLVGMRERAGHLGGELTIQRGQPKGTMVLARIPCSRPPNAE